MPRTYNVIDADGHVLEPIDIWDKYIDPAFRDRAPRIVIDTDGKERLDVEGQVLGSQKGFGVVGAIGARQGDVAGRDDDSTSTAARAASIPTPAFPTWISTASTPPSSIRASASSRARSRIRSSRPRCAAPTTAGSPTTAGPIPTGSSGWRCCRCSRSTPPSRRCASRATSSACARASCARTRTTARMLHHPDYTPFWNEVQELDFAIGLHEGASGGMPQVGVDRFETRGARHIISHTMEMMLAAMSVIWSGVCDRFPRVRIGFMETRRRLDRAVARPHGPPLRRQGLQRLGALDAAERAVPAQLLDLVRARRADA